MQPEKKPLSFPPWVLAFTHLSHLLVTFACSANFYIYFAKYGSRSIFRKRKNERISQRCQNHSHGINRSEDNQLEIEDNGCQTQSFLSSREKYHVTKSGSSKSKSIVLI